MEKLTDEKNNNFFSMLDNKIIIYFSITKYVLALFFMFWLAFAIKVLSILPNVKPTSMNPMLGALTQTIIYTCHMGFAYLEHSQQWYYIGIMLKFSSINIKTLL